MQKTNYAKKKKDICKYIYVYIYGTNGLKTIECTHTRNGQKKLYIWIYNIYKLFTHRYIVLHILVRARLRDQDLDVERAFFVRLFFPRPRFYREPQPNVNISNVWTYAMRERNVTRRRWTSPIPLLGKARSIESRARGGFSASRFRDLRPAVWEARISRRKRRGRKKRDRQDK